MIDVGTNSVKFHIGERDADGRWRTIVDRAEMTRLGEDLDVHNTISAEPLERTLAAIAGMVEEARSCGVRETAAVGTAGLRFARNRDDVVAAIRARTGVTVEVIPGEEEGRLAYLAVQAELDVTTGSLVVFDTGGGSTQFTFGRRPARRGAASVCRSVRCACTERFGLADAVGPEVLREVLAAISADLSAIDGRPPPDALVAMGGAVTNITAVKLGLASYDPDAVQGAALDRAEIDRQIELLPVARRRRPPRDRRPAAQARGRHPRRRLHRPDDHGEAGQADTHGERPWAPSRAADRPVRGLTGLPRYRCGGGL